MRLDGLRKELTIGTVIILIILPLTAYGTVYQPTLKWQYGGCHSSWCEIGWYSSPAVADLDGDGSVEVIASAYSIVALRGSGGSVLWRVVRGDAGSKATLYSARYPAAPPG